MFTISIDTEKARQIPASLKAWCAAASKGPKALVAELQLEKPAAAHHYTRRRF